MANNKDGRIHTGMYINPRLWVLAWYGGKLSKRSRPDYIAHAVANQLKADGIINDVERVPIRHTKRIREMLAENPPDPRTAKETLSLFKNE